MTTIAKWDDPQPTGRVYSAKCCQQQIRVSAVMLPVGRAVHNPGVFELDAEAALRDHVAALNHFKKKRGEM